MVVRRAGLAVVLLAVACAAQTRYWRHLGDARSASGRPLPGIEARTPSDPRERPQQKGASPYNPGWNLFSPQQDVQMGQQAEQQALKQLPILHYPAAESYLTQLGTGLARHMPGPTFPYNFHWVNQKEINAFALPGGPIFVNVGAACAAKNEAQFAGVVAHEESHVALRHSTSMASKKEAVSVPLGILGGLFNSGAGRIANLGAQMVVGGVFLKYSRDMESQADALGAQVMNASGYDPRQMAQFFETLEAQGGSQSLQFLSDHPSPGNRLAAITAEIPTLGPHPPYQDDSAAFDRLHRQLCTGKLPAQTSEQGITFQGITLTPPTGWTVYGDQTSQLTLVPAGGLSGAGDQTQVLSGAIISTYAGSLQQLIAELQRSNPDLRPVSGTQAPFAAGGLHGTAITLSNQNAERAPETDRLVHFPRQGADALYLIFIAPSSEFDRFRPAFGQLLQSLKAQ